MAIVTPKIDVELRGFFENDYFLSNPTNLCSYAISTSLKIKSSTQYSNYIGNLEKVMQFATALQPLAEEWNNQ